jgi:hypothetical protein
MFTIPQVAEELGTTPALLFDLIASGDIVPVEGPLLSRDQVEALREKLPDNRSELIRRLRDEQVIDDAIAEGSKLLEK